MISRYFVIVASVMVGLAGSARAAVVFGNFEDGTTNNFGALTSSSGVQPWASPVNGQNTTFTSGSLGAKVLELTGSAAFNFGQSGGGALGYDLLANGLRSAFLANDHIEFDWYAPPNGGSGGYLQLYNIVLNSQGGGYSNITGWAASNPDCNQYYYTGFNGAAHHVSVDYSAYKNTILGSANPDAGGWLQFGIQLNAGGGAPGDIYFDNFQLTSTVPEPASLSLLALASAGLLARRRRYNSGSCVLADNPPSHTGVMR